MQTVSSSAAEQTEDASAHVLIQIPKALQDPIHKKTVIPPPIFKKYFMRWIILLLFSLLSFSNAMVWITFAPIDVLTMRYFKVSSDSVNWLSLIYMVTYIPGSFVSSFIIEKTNLKFGLILGSALNSIGSWVRIAGAIYPDSFAVLFTGQTLCGISQTFILSIPPELSANWFPDNERTTAVSLGTLCNQVGIAFGFLLSPWIVSRDDYHQTFVLLMVVQSIVCTVSGFLITIMFQTFPPHPPSISAHEKRLAMRREEQMKKKQKRMKKKKRVAVDSIRAPLGEHVDAPPRLSTELRPRSSLDTQPRHNVHHDHHHHHDVTSSSAPLQSTVQVLKAQWLKTKPLIMPFLSIHFIFVMLGFGIVTGCVYAFSTLLGAIVGPQGYSPQDAGLFGFIFIIAGCPAAFFIGLLADKTKRYLIIMKVVFTMTSLAFVAFTLCLYVPAMNQMWIIIITLVLMGFTTTALLPICFEVGVEVTYPAAENISAALQTNAAQVFGIVLTSAMNQFIIRDALRNYAMWFCVGITVVSGVMMLFFRGKLKRLELENAKKKENQLGAQQPASSGAHVDDDIAEAPREIPETHPAVVSPSAPLPPVEVELVESSKSSSTSNSSAATVQQQQQQQ